jgi:hypothetical protein
LKRNLLLAAAAALMALASNATAGYVYELELTGTSPTPWSRVAGPDLAQQDEPVVITIADSGIFQVSRLADVAGLPYAEGISLALYLEADLEWGDRLLATTWDREVEVASAAIEQYVPGEEAFEE